jgi:hypothetical protein
VEEAVVPPWLSDQPQLVLQIGLDLPVPIPDLRVDDVGVYGTLSFNRAPFTCSVPWEAVFAVVSDDGQGMIWPESVPSEISAEIEREAGRQPPPGPAAEEQPGAKDNGASERPASSGGDEKVIPLDAFRSASSAASPASPGSASPGEPSEPEPAASSSVHSDEGSGGRTDPQDGEPVEQSPAPDDRAASASKKRSDGSRRGRGRRERELPPYLKVVK